VTVHQEPHANRKLLFYPGGNLSPAERRKIDDYTLELHEITGDHLVYALSRQVEKNFQTFYSLAEEVVGEQRALEIAEAIGSRYGGTGYATWLASHGYEGAGTPQTMARYQDLVHAIRGPKHTAALFAHYDDERCVVRRNACIYFDDDVPDNGKYTGAFERGCFAGYKRADENIVDIEVLTCRWRGDAGCEIHWVFDRDRAAETAAKMRAKA
jgi:hypothetical protein